MNSSEPPVIAEPVARGTASGPRIVGWGAALFLLASWVCLALTYSGYYHDFTALFYIPGFIAAALSGFASCERPGVISATLAVATLVALLVSTPND